MRVSRVNPDSNDCTLEIDLPWEVAQAIYDFGPELLIALGTALRERRATATRKAVDRQRLDEDATDNRAQWAAWVAECEAEIRRRANSPTAKNGIIKQFAGERGIPVGMMHTLLRVYRADAKALLKGNLLRQVAHLESKGLTQRAIGATLGIPERQVRNYLALARQQARQKRPGTTGEQV